MILIPFLVLSTSYCVQSELFTAMADVETLLYAERGIVDHVDEYIRKEQLRLQRLKDYAKEYDERTRQLTKSGRDYLGNPANAYLMVKRMTSDWDYVESLMRNTAADSIISNITQQRDRYDIKFPTTEDVDGAAIALMRLQDTYQMRAQDIADGEIEGVDKDKEKFTAHDCFQLGRVAYNQQDYYHCIIWMEETMSRLQRQKKGQDSGVDEPEMLEYLAYCYYQQGNVQKSLKESRRLKQMVPNHPRIDGNIEWYENEMRDSGIKDDGFIPPVQNQRPPGWNNDEFKTYEELCRGEHPLDADMQRRLRCRLKRDTPFLLIAPLKYEEHHLKPLIVLYKNVISDYEIGVIKELATPKLERAEIVRAEGVFEYAKYRISKTAWLKDYEHPVVHRINNRITDMSGLDMATAEELQIANYGIGGHYEPHFDMSTRGESDPYGTGDGNRIATALFYMEAPVSGGATVFVDLKLSVFPSQYDAAFWFNLRTSGKPDMNTRHAGCPVLVGNKWVSNKWIHERGQEFRRTCSVDEDEYQ